MSKFFKKVYKYTPLGWYTKGLKKLGVEEPDDFMEETLSNRSDLDIAAQILTGVLGGTGALGGSAASAGAGATSEAGAAATKAAASAPIAQKILKALGVVAPYAYAEYSRARSEDYSSAQADKTYARQNEFYEQHLSMPAKVAEFEEAGLNPYALAGSGVGATSAPNVEQAQAPEGIAGMLGEILGAVTNSKRVEAQNRLTDAETFAKTIQNQYEERMNAIKLQREEWALMRDKLGYEIDEQTLRIATTNADNLDVLAVYYPEMLEADINNKNAQAALADAQTSLTEEEEKRVAQQIEQANERFPEEMKQLRAMTAQIRANTELLKANKELTVEQRKKIIEETTNVIKERARIIKDTNLKQKEYDCYEATHSTVTVVPDLGGDKDRVVVKHTDGTISQFDMPGWEKKFHKDLHGNKVKKKK